MLDFLGADILRFQLGQPGVQILTAASFPHILRDINRRLTAEGQGNGIARSGIDGTCDSFVFEEDARIVCTALDVGENRLLHFNAEVLAETLDQIVTHRSWRGRCVQGASDGFTFRCAHPYHKMVRRAVGSGQHDNPGIRRRVFYNSIDRKLYQWLGRLRRVLFHTCNNKDSSSGVQFSEVLWLQVFQPLIEFLRALFSNHGLTRKNWSLGPESEGDGVAGTGIDGIL